MCYSFWRVTAPNPVNTAFFTLFEPIFCLDERKKRSYLRVSQKIEDCDVTKPLNNSLLATLGTKTVVFTRVLAS